jgi:hypothetical protein
MNFSKYITLMLFASTTANAGLVADKSEVAFPDIYKSCYSDTATVTVTWDGGSTNTHLDNLQVSMTGNSDEFLISGLNAANPSNTSTSCHCVAGVCTVDPAGECSVDIVFAPVHSGVKNKKLNFYGTYTTIDSLNNETINDVSVTIPVTGTSYPQNNPNAAPYPEDCPNP